MGRHTTFTPEIGAAICERLEKGESLRAICRDEGMPAESAVRRWALDDVGGFHAQYMRAREIQYLAMAEELTEIADDARNDWMAVQDDDGGEAYRLNGEHVQRSRLRTDTRKWLLSKMLPKVFGDKLAHTGPDGTGPAKVVMQVITGVPHDDDDD
jgi:hypothetical protein